MTCSSSIKYGLHRILFTVEIIVVSVLLLAMVAAVSSQSTSSPCPNIFNYQYNSDTGEYLGLIQVPSPPLGSTLHLVVNLTLNARLPTSYVGRLELYDQREMTIQRISNQLPIRYKVLFPLRYPFPRLTYITYNGQILCSGDTGYNNLGAYVTQIGLEHKLYTTLAGDRRFPMPYPSFNNNNIPGQQNPQPNYQPPQQYPPPPPPPPTTTTTTTTYRPTIDYSYPYPYPDIPQDLDVRNRQSGGFEQQPSCGRVDPQYDVTLLVLGGEEVKRGQFPWLTAIHVYQQTALNFRCGGNLISDKVVVSAGHCFKGREGVLFKPEDIVVSLGQHNIRKLHDPRTVTMGLESLNIHPDFLKDPKGSYDADIAILILEGPVTFSEFIKPVCLWSGVVDETQVFGKQGVVVGWGKDESGSLVTKAPKRATIPIVSHLECVRSSETFLRITSARTICGGGKNDAGPCNGDSGGGLILYENGTWQLRGIISVALADPVSGMCNLKQFVVFTDVAKFLDWIRMFL